MNVSLELARINDLIDVIPLVKAYHEFEEIDANEEQIRGAVTPLLITDHAGRIWFVTSNGEHVGYVALCFGYSIEFRGRDAFLDELFIKEGHRGKGIGKEVLRLLEPEAKKLGVKALHLEVAHENDRAKRLYETCGFKARDRYLLMSKKL